jgi:HPt (histidine-containing phosphotransfer) domain-containing protein
MSNTPEGPSTAAPDSEDLDTDGLVYRCGDDAELACAVLEEFARCYPSLLQRLDDGLLAGDAIQVDHALHAISGVAANVGAGRIASDGIALRRRVVSGGIDSVASELDIWRRAFQRLPGQATEAAERLARVAG